MPDDPYFCHWAEDHPSGRPETVIYEGEFGASYERFSRYRCPGCGASYPESVLARKRLQGKA